MIFALGAGAALLLVVVLGYFLLVKGPNAITLAVLPFKDLSPEQNQSVFCEGISDDIRRRLSSVGTLNIISKYSSDRFKNMTDGLKEIERKLGVRKILSGTLQIENDQIRVTVELSDAESEITPWSRRYDRKLEGYFLVEDTIAEAVAEELKVQLSPLSVQAAIGSEPANWNAYTEFRWGKFFESNYRDRRKDEDFQEAVRRYRKAIEYDPDYCPAYWGLGDAYESHYVRTSDPNDQALMERYYTRSFEINGNLPESAVRMGWVYFYREDMDHAFSHFHKAEELGPNNHDVNFLIGSFLRSLGLYRNALSHYQRAVELDPLSFRTYLTYISCLSHIGDFEKALALAKQAVDIEPNVPRTHTFYARQLILVNEYDQAEQELVFAEKIQPDEPMISRLGAWLAAARRQKNAALALIQKSDAPYTYEIVNAYCLLGMNEEAIRGIQEGIEKGFRMVKDYLYGYPYLTSNPLFKTLGKDPRFLTILADQKEQYERRLNKYGAL
jgi:TolB-like protein/Tfp pilus assembly protein PilF